MKNVSYVNVADEKNKEAANSGSPSDSAMDVTALMNLIEKKGQDKIMSPKINKSDFFLSETANNSNEEISVENLEITSESGGSFGKYFLTMLVVVIAVVAFIGMLYAIDNKAKNWVKTHKSEQVLPEPISKKNANELFNIISKQ